ncbi:unnamed protein product [Mytilus edulis]|uniref:Dynamin N-terminal domain-containing protein n=1 Tax=Mytilus edulis TaxID=6550 RepID=A0A8S3Q5P6_MYTED|nr:unnamed protein product [Mytilus edulis]
MLYNISYLNSYVGNENSYDYIMAQLYYYEERPSCMASNTNEDLEQTMKTLELKKNTCEQRNELVKTAQHVNKHKTHVGEERKDLTEKDDDTSLLRRSCPDEQIKRLRVMFESVEDMLSSPDYDEDLKSELSAALPKYKTDLQTAKRDLLRNDCGIVVAGETSAGKTTLINQLVNKKIFATNSLAATGKITRIRNSESMKIKCYSKDETLLKEEDVQDEKELKSSIKRLTKIGDDLKDIHFVDVYLPVPILKGNVIIIDTPGIGDEKMINNRLLEFLPNAVAFVFVVNAHHAGGVHKKGLLKILKTIKDNESEMPCFDPRDALFLTNHMTQVEEGVNTFFTAEYKRFERVLQDTIENNKNKRVVFYYRFLKKFIRHAERVYSLD